MQTSAIAEKMNLTQQSDVNQSEAIIEQVLAENAQAVSVVISGKNSRLKVTVLDRSCIMKSATFSHKIVSCNVVVLGSVIEDIEVCLVGEGSVLKTKEDTVCQENVNS